MNTTYKSILFQTIFLAITALQLIFIPNTFLNTFGFETTSEFWIKILGVVILALAVLYYGINQNPSTAVVKWTTYARSTATIGFVALIVTGAAPINLVVFALLDVATALWTIFELKTKKEIVQTNTQ
jgi:hypothetical protein